jgi:formylmethanofuran dehydrogenase subunit B
MWNNEIEQRVSAITCPCCGLSCDDLKIEVSDGQRLSTENGCELARAFYATASEHTDTTPRIDGEPSSLAEAIDHGAALLRDSRAPLFAGLATDVNGMRSILRLADRCGATLDHLNGDAMFRNVRVVQDNGWFTTTFTEVRNRADLILLVGSQCIERFPRLVERILNPPESLFSGGDERTLVLLGPWGKQSLPEELARLNPRVIRFETEALADAVGLLRALIAGKPVNLQQLDDNLGAELEALAKDLRAAKYSVISWCAAELDHPHAELAVQGLAELAKDLNSTSRSAALPLAGTQADITSNQVCTWQLGYPLRTRLQRGYPQHDPLLNRWQDLLRRNESDLLLWVSSISPQAPPPPCDVPTIVLGHAGTVFEREPAIHIPVGVPGVDHQGHWYRSDAVCSLPLGKLREVGLPPVSHIVNLLYEKLQNAIVEVEGGRHAD